MRYDDGLEIERALVIYAHPDDAEFGCAGTVAAWARAGVEVTYVLVTNGASGSSDPELTREKLIEIRRREQQEAADVLGVKEVVHLGFEDGYLYPDLELRKAVAREIRRYRPDVILCPHDPRQRTFMNYYLNHPDHIAVGEVVMRSINPDASSGLWFPEIWKQEGLEPHLPAGLFLSNFLDGDGFVDITETLETKVAALTCHRSQMDNPEETAGFVRERAEAAGKRWGVRYAESFSVFRFR